MIESALICLALNIYHESRGEPVRGQLAVALVTLNRAKWMQHRVCTEVYRAKQFSWTNYPPQVIQDQKAFKQALAIAKAASQIPDFTQGATHFHRQDIKPYWSTSYQPVEQIGNHIFYRKG